MLPSFASQRLALKPRTLADLDDCLAMDRDPEVTRHVDGPWHEPDAHRRFVVDRIARAYPDGLGYWSIFERSAPARFVGWVLLIPEDTHGPEVEIGWRLVREAWGRGIASEAARIVVAHAFGTVGLESVVAGIAEGNVASQRVAQKLGMKREGNVDGYVRFRLARADLSIRRSS
ncbi:GNAT family N-acetyltransferase [Paraburkholderia hospita]|uniref:N-acetyltransferase GCN5 n=1 Tax=Paraburkholderia hospita TaxID=169430 RepID=A0ABP2PIS4_9BURK|nr:GNAT family N-acetyltransferase [Paraburkholderia hospita]AXE98731.1 N-acetyltransferase [Paraburkholderia hospita]EIM97434.1 N-acetyltransferase GCN5 [Paraburkholderia hospita]OUL78810.1 N-acetyltransferase [Paraburkholderia hospita]OUL81170.1 N-acetyltransferase [Paraburkholderia hospita]OUL91574.1 N-acetyltransferase [Paraburkholderia hospita]